MKRICKQCKLEKKIEDYYKSPCGKDGYAGKCKQCVISNMKIRNVERVCFTCNKPFLTWQGEINRGAGITCSRKCYYERFRKIVKRESNSPNWKGNKVGRQALHNWVERNLGKPKKCEKCHRTDCKKYEWANISRKYMRDLKDWIRLCKRCHIIYDGSKCQKNYKRLNISQFKKLDINKV